ncbi:GxGYxYP domain-containing protein [Paenibacillus lignilyticus]|uniref:GxGYxY sequence motif-containing protein n=1 Tax=Paenibacillus lignilyticus TaxID=1172615 RepID=A0ABS5CIG2_9BACL|nr:GxGYxYP domain-containing protein [Paenibacillus lignilyticus]MBP3965604.1 hypothetical protein [Paenibacillus lignilyticus]
MKGRFILLGSLVVVAAAAVTAYFAWPAKSEGVHWPEGQALPTFEEPASTLDLMYTTDNFYYQAEDASFAHKTGKADGDGWLAAAGSDAPNVPMLDITDQTNIPAGENKAIVNMQVDSFANENGVVAKLEVLDQEAGMTLASLDVSNWDFKLPNASQSFELPFTVPEGGHSLEFRVQWTGKSTLKLFDVGISWALRKEENLVFTSLKGVVNKTQPRLYAFTDNVNGSTGTSWLASLGLAYKEEKDNWKLLDKYRSEVKGIVVYDDSQPDTVNLATTIAGLKDGIVAPPALVEKLTGDPYNLPILEDLRGDFTSKLEVYEFMLSNYWPKVTHRVIIGLDPSLKSYLRDYAMNLTAAVVWLNPKEPKESELLDKFLTDMPYGSGLYMGWWPDEGEGVKKTSDFGLATVASDYSSNLSVFSGTSREITVPELPKKPPLENKIYVSFILSDGDNLQYMEHSFKKFWDTPDRGEVPLGWTVSPLMVDTMPGILNFLYKTATPNDALISGPSGMGYTYPNFWKDGEGLDNFVTRTNDYMSRAGLRVLTIWNYVKGEITPEAANRFAEHAPSLLGFTSQFGTGKIEVYKNELPGQELNVSYGSTEGDLTNGIEAAIKKWDGKSPAFVAIQANPWQVSYQNFVNARDHYLSNTDVVFVRPDTYFQLVRESKGLPIEPNSSTK